ncbi:dipeptidyl peptidase 1-like [Hydractinia symbiolongicarpus]|uniref:dipeptidyl peptidase 1-like n=1 Tax=Hydractinia symbiolongicarpus TaxID=13093 RepID=UPI002550ED8D|nr:dipeptidyl peptidase 1-like [Hydractinia symbiolongicarpus]
MWKTIILLSIMICSAVADFPTNCSFEDTVGKWTFFITDTNHDHTIDCNEPVEVKTTLSLELLFPNNVVDQHGNVGTWTMIYNQGFAVILNGRRFFAFQFFDHIGPVKNITSFCDKTFNGWVHDSVSDNTFPPKNWGCYYAKKQTPTNPKLTTISNHKTAFSHQSYGLQQDLVDQINHQQTSWKAGVYKEFENATLYDMLRRVGGSSNLPRIKPSKITPDMEKMASDLPEQFDWRNTKGGDFVSPVRNQGQCGSCYAFASMAVLEASVRIGTNNAKQPVFSPQNIVACSNYSQGCSGGFAYLVAGMYAQNFGVVSEESYPYVGNDTKCDGSKGGARTYVSDYGYVGGFYGGTNEALMRVALLKYGPLAVGIYTYPDFFQYKGGIYHHTGLKSNFKFNPFEATTHAVLVVGYGVENNEKFWIVKNSWGANWGEEGYIRVRRGTDEIAIESVAVYAKAFVG